MSRYAWPEKRGFILYRRWPAIVRGIAGIDREFDELTDEEKSALTVSERNAVGGKIEARE